MRSTIAARKWVLAASVMTGSVVVCHRGVAEPKPEPPKSEEERRWYGWQTLTMDGVVALSTIGVLTGMDATQAGDMVFPLLGAYVLGTPVVHAAHANAVAMPSFVIRLLAPPAGFLAGGVFQQAVFGTQHGCDCAPFSPGAVVGALVGIGGRVGRTIRVASRLTARLVAPAVEDALAALR